MIQRFRGLQTKALNLPFSDAVRAGDLLFVSGVLGNRPSMMELVPGGIRNETRQTLDNLKQVLQQNGASLGQMVKITVFLADIAEWAAFNEVYRAYFADDELPARSALGSSGLALGARVELDGIAYLGQ